MRRALSISLILLLWLPAFAALVPGTDDARLPFCCRRQGAHHCAMEESGAKAQVDGSGPGFKAPSRCAEFPASLPATVSPAFAVAAAPSDWPPLASGRYTRVASREAAHTGRLLAQLDRGPPSSHLA